MKAHSRAITGWDLPCRDWEDIIAKREGLYRHEFHGFLALRLRGGGWVCPKKRDGKPLDHPYVSLAVCACLEVTPIFKKILIEYLTPQQTPESFHRIQCFVMLVFDYFARAAST